MAPHRRFRSVLKHGAMPIEGLPKACFPEASPAHRAVFEFGFRLRIPRLYRPGKHHQAVVWLNSGQLGPIKGMEALSHWSLAFHAKLPPLPGSSTSSSNSAIVCSTVLWCGSSYQTEATLSMSLELTLT